MTDNEIIKANACCANEDFQDCKYCPLYIEHQPCNKTLLPKITLDLLNRQKAEIEHTKQMYEAAVAGQETLQKHMKSPIKQVEQMTNSEALRLIDCIVANAIDRIYEQKIKEGYLEGIVEAIAAVFEVQGRPNDENNA